jgi:hypothetical protein
MVDEFLRKNHRGKLAQFALAARLSASRTAIYSDEPRLSLADFTTLGAHVSAVAEHAQVVDDSLAS